MKGATQVGITILYITLATITIALIGGYHELFLFSLGILAGMFIGDL